MHDLVGPLWGFFQFLRNKSPIPLAIEQYSYFFSALHHTDSPAITSADDLLAFTKIFWLSVPAFEDQYDYYFKTFLDWDKLLPQHRKETDSRQHQSIRQENETSPVIEKKEPVSPVSSTPESTASTKTGPEEMQVDFKLVLQETEHGQAEDKDIYPATPHDFVLSDFVIMPFDNRTFIQRLRRKVETAELVPTDQLDIPAMIHSFVLKGFIGDIAYELNDASHSNVVLLADRNDSMLAFEFLEQHFVNGLNQLPHCHFEHYAFNTLPAQTSDGRHYKLTAVQPDQPDIETHRHAWNQETWFLLFSDAGAMTGIVERERIKSTIRWWTYLKSISPHVHWINPVPFDSMNDCTAKRLQMSIPMVDPTDKSLYQMIHAMKSHVV